LAFVNPNKRKKSKSNKKVSEKSSKSYKIDQSKVNSRVAKKDEIVDISKVEKEEVDLPVYCTTPDKGREMDLFIVHVMIQSQRDTVKPYFIGNYSSKSYDMQIKSSSMTLNPRDVVKDNFEDVVNLKRK